MPRITVNTSGSAPTLVISTNTSNPLVNPLAVICLQDITISNSTGVFSWTDFCSQATNKITTPADNEISANMVVDDVVFFGNTATTAGSAPFLGVSGLSNNRTPVGFRLIMNGTTSTTGAYFYQGTGYISNVAPTVSADSPVWVSPITVAVDGAFTTGRV